MKTNMGKVPTQRRGECGYLMIFVVIILSRKLITAAGFDKLITRYPQNISELNLVFTASVVP